MTVEDYKNTLPIVAIVISLISLYFTRKNWIQSNRPIVVAYISEVDSSAGGTIFNLKVSNTGTRLAVRVKIHMNKENLEKIIDPKAPGLKFDDIARNFDAESEISLIKKWRRALHFFWRIYSQ